MEEEVAVSHSLGLVVNNLLTTFILVVNGELLFNWKRPTKLGSSTPAMNILN